MEFDVVHGQHQLAGSVDALPALLGAQKKFEDYCQGCHTGTSH